MTAETMTGGDRLMWGARPLIIGHRGAPRVAHENSVAAVDAAIEFGADMVEIDVRRTGDGSLVVHHDATFQGRPVRTQSASTLKRAGDHAPAMLEEVVEVARGRTLLDVELKRKGYERQVLDLLARDMSAREFVITSFSAKAIEVVKRLWPAVRTGLLVGPAPREASEILARVDRCGADLLALHVRQARHAIGQDLPVFVWTVNDAETLRDCLRAGVAGIITDVPDVAVRLRYAHCTGSTTVAA